MKKNSYVLSLEAQKNLLIKLNTMYIKMLLGLTAFTLLIYLFFNSVVLDNKLMFFIPLAVVAFVAVLNSLELSVVDRKLKYTLNVLTD